MAQAAGIDDVFGELEVIPTALLIAHLNDLLRFEDDFDELIAFIDRMRHGLFDIDVLTCVDGIHDHGGVPMIGRTDYDGVDIGIREEFMVVGIEASVGSELRLRGVEARSVDVTEGDDTRSAGFSNEIENVGAAATGADAADANGVVRSQDS